MFSFLTFLFCKYIFLTNNNLIKDSAVTYKHVILKILLASLNRFLLIEIPSTQKYTYLVIKKIMLIKKIFIAWNIS